jgi:hypothetical protein
MGGLSAIKFGDLVGAVVTGDPLAGASTVGVVLVVVVGPVPVVVGVSVVDRWCVAEARPARGGAVPPHAASATAAKKAPPAMMNRVLWVSWLIGLNSVWPSRRAASTWNYVS